ncbi:MAG TPA: Ni-sirohydrochlorin a,c-diamide reductive cyclase catalytic subunit [Methanomassiliicoccales archaeon]|jgi:putative methanogenesis marker 13 metalloprotein
MNRVLHPRPNPIIAAMYTLRDLDVDLIILHGPAGCGFMASRRLEEAGVKVMTTGMQENDLIFGAEENLIDVLRTVDRDFTPKTIGIIGTCASMIIGENLDSAVRKAGIRAMVLPVDVHGCSGANTNGAIRVLEVAASKGLIPVHECERQKAMLTKATAIEKDRGITSRTYLEPSNGATKLAVALKITKALREGQTIAVTLNAKKETAYGFADIFRAVEMAKRKLGGRTVCIANLDRTVGLPRIRRYSEDILRDLGGSGITDIQITGGLDEYPIAGEKAADMLDAVDAEVRIIAGLPHSLPRLRRDDVLVTDQPRELRNYLDKGFQNSVGEISTHADVMSTHSIIDSELGNTIREVVEKDYR